MTGPHNVIEPDGLPRARGYSHGVSADPGRTVWVAGQLGVDADGRLAGDTFPEQFDAALGNVVAVLEAADAEAGHVVSMQIFTTDVKAYLDSMPDLGEIYRTHMDKHYPAMALLEVSALVDSSALVEITAVAVVPDQ